MELGLPASGSVDRTSSKQCTGTTTVMTCTRPNNNAIQLLRALIIWTRPGATFWPAQGDATTQHQRTCASTAASLTSLPALHSMAMLARRSLPPKTLRPAIAVVTSLTGHPKRPLARKKLHFSTLCTQTHGPAPLRLADSCLEASHAPRQQTPAQANHDASGASLLALLFICAPREPLDEQALCYSQARAAANEVAPSSLVEACSPHRASTSESPAKHLHPAALSCSETSACPS